jgi:pimeloyl-ACP methyl ester carboxylesterase
MKSGGLVASATVFLLLATGCSTIERQLLYFPSHRPASGGLTPWTKDGAVIGYARQVEAPKNVWLMLHGNGGQASGRGYALPSFSPQDSVFILEYPGYGNRPGVPSRDAFNRAATEAYAFLRASYPRVPVCAAGESLGTGPASHLASLPSPPDKVVLIVAFDQLSLVAREHYPTLVVGLLLSDDWDNVAALSHYRGPVEIYGAAADTVIPVTHAKALAAAVPGAKFVLIDGGHNDWSRQDRVRIRNP